jgi:adenylate cyclase
MARQYYHTGNIGDARRDEAVVRLCKRATQIDPGYARAWAMMALAQTWQRFFHGEVGDGGLASAERALALDPNLAEAHAVKANILFFQEGRVDPARAELLTALRLDPESYDVNRIAANLYYRERRFDEAIRHYEKISALMESDFASPGMLTSCYNAIGNAAAARNAAQISLARVEKALQQDQSNGSSFGFGVGALLTMGEVERAKDWIARAVLIDPDNSNMRYNFACAAAADLKDPDFALELLGPCLETVTLEFLEHVKVDPDLDSLHDDPRLKAMIAATEARLAKTAPGS